MHFVSQISRKMLVNNHATNGRGFVDRSVKAWQQKLLHALRILSNLSISDGEEDSYVSVLHLFHLIAELEQSFLDFRRGDPSYIRAKGWQHKINTK